MARMNSSSAFFKFFMADSSSKEMKIPRAFSQRIEKALPEKVCFRDRYNNIWTVKMARVGDVLYFKEGWVQFIGDNLVTDGDLLVFQRVSDSVFDVKVYEPSGTQKKGVGRFLDDSTIENQEQISKDEDKDEDEMRSEDFDHIFRGEEQVCATAGSTTGENTHERPAIEVELGRRRPKNPYFVTRIRQKRKGDLFIPKDIVKYCKNIDFAQGMSLVDPDGREFAAKCRKWTDGRVIVSGGWRSLCKMNEVKKDDRCTCEFVQGEGRRLLLNVSFDRANRR